MEISFVASFGPITRDGDAARACWGAGLGITLEEPWGQTTSRLLSPEGLLVGVTFTPWMH